MYSIPKAENPPVFSQKASILTTSNMGLQGIFGRVFNLL
jgi:hypothetical protein